MHEAHAYVGLVLILWAVDEAMVKRIVNYSHGNTLIDNDTARKHNSMSSCSHSPLSRACYPRQYSGDEQHAIREGGSLWNAQLHQLDPVLPLP